MTRAQSKPAMIAGLATPAEVAGYRYGVEVAHPRPWVDGEHAALLRRTAEVGAAAVQREWDGLVREFGSTWRTA